MKVKAKLYDGITAHRQDVDILFIPNGLYFPSGDVWLYGDLKLVSSDKVTGELMYENTYKPGPALTLLFEKGMDDPARDYLSRISKKLTADSNWHFVRWQFITSVAIVGLLFLFYLGYPFLNRAIVATVPNSWVVNAGDLVIDGLYQQYSSKVCHSADGDKALQKIVDAAELDGLAYPLRVEIVDHPQVNALTAPGGRIVMFSGLINQAGSADEVAGVLAHEVGHVYYQHPMQGLVNVLGFSIIGSFIGGDAASIAVVGLSLSYNRDLERDADTKALEILNNKDISAQGILKFFIRMNEKKKDNMILGLDNIFSTHPLTDERIANFSDHIDKNEIDRQFTAVLTADEWQSLKGICNSPDSETE